MNQFQFEKSTDSSIMNRIGLNLPYNFHSGRTDKNGGHRDLRNASGLASYHYHNEEVILYEKS